MLKISKGDSYVPSRRKEMSSYLGSNRAARVKNQLMIIHLPKRTMKLPPSVSDQAGDSSKLQLMDRKCAEDSYYSFLSPSTESINSYSEVMRDDQNDVLRISLVSMAIYECYLYALGLPMNFPVEHIIVHGEDKNKLLPSKISSVRKGMATSHLYDYELTVPVNTEREEYCQRILNELNEHFQLEVRVEKLSVVKGSRQILNRDRPSVELIWGEQTTMIMKTKIGLKTADPGRNRPVVKKLKT